MFLSRRQWIDFSLMYVQSITLFKTRENQSTDVFSSEDEMHNIVFHMFCD